MEVPISSLAVLNQIFHQFLNELEVKFFTFEFKKGEEL